jgi:hypothetical protein
MSYQTKISNLQYISISDIDMADWDNIIKEFNGTYYYSAWSNKYTTELSKVYDTENYTLLIKNTKENLAIFPIFVENDNGNKKISYNTINVYSILFNQSLSYSDSMKIIDIYFKELDKLQIKFNIKSAKFQIDPILAIQNNSKFNHINYYLLNHYTDKSELTYVLELDKTIEQLWTNVRKRYRNYINQMKKYDFDIKILNRNNCSKELFEQFLELHISIKGNNRSVKAFEMDYEAIINGSSVVFLFFKDNQIQASLQHYIYENIVIPNSAMQLYDYDEKNYYPYHYIYWESIKYFKEENMKYYYIGNYSIENDTFNPSKKEKNITFFKSGWGGELYPWIKAEKVYNVSTV